MDDATLSSLEAALRASPDNAPLRSILLKAYVQASRVSEANRLIGASTAQDFPDAGDRQAIAKFFLDQGDAARALSFAEGDEPQTLILRARALVALGRGHEAGPLYEKAVALNPTLEDVDLRVAVSARVREVETAGGQGPRAKLRVIANDDTDASELNRVLSPPQRTITFEDVGGHEEIKEQIRKRIILPFQKPSLFQKFRKKVGGGILLFGPPGCGKTLLARATAGECNATFFNVVISDVLDMYIGESERKLHALFEQARQKTPAVLFFDELEALAAKRQYTREGTSSKLVSQFLSEMDGFSQENKGVLVLGATNVPWAIDAAFRRPGRFDRVVFVPPPDVVARQAILELSLANRPRSGELDLLAIAKATSGFTGADLENLVETAADSAIERSLSSNSEEPITQSDLERARKEVKPTSLEWLSTARNYARYANESGQYDDVLAFLEKNTR